jgi:hypothetical protein
MQPFINRTLKKVQGIVNKQGLFFSIIVKVYTMYKTIDITYIRSTKLPPF